MPRIHKEKQLAIRRLRSAAVDIQQETIDFLQTEVNRLGRQLHGCQRVNATLHTEIRALNQTIKDLRQELRHLNQREARLQYQNLRNRVTELEGHLRVQGSFVPPQLERTYSSNDLGFRFP